SVRRWTHSSRAWRKPYPTDSVSAPTRPIPTMSAPTPRSGIALYLAALVTFASFDAAMKHLLNFYPAPFLNVMRYLSVATIGVGLLIRRAWPRREPTGEQG